MIPQTIYLMRHGLATHSTTGYGDTILTATILPEAIPVVKKIAEYLKDKPTNANFSSEFLRCKQTAKIVTDITNKQFEFDKRLNEFYDETFLQFKERLQNFIEDLEQKNVPHVLICTHGAVIAGLKHLLLRNTVLEENLLDFALPNVLTTIENGKIHEIDFS